jgi:hypothetical protein
MAARLRSDRLRWVAFRQPAPRHVAAQNNFADTMWYYKLQARLTKRFFPERAQQWRRWKQHDPQATVTIAHERWDRFLATYVVAGADGINRVRYAEVSPADRDDLSAYLADCARQPISGLARDEQYAFWLNLYNAVTVAVVLQHYPLRSMRNVGALPSWLGGGPWDRPRIRVEGFALSLNDIEHRILRRNWRDPRIHYAVNCGAIGCPNLPQRAFRGGDVHTMLDALAAGFVNSPRGVELAGDTLIACRIFSWFREDFGGTEAAVIEHLRRHAAPALRARLEGRTRIDRYRYDWSLNDAARG